MVISVELQLLGVFQRISGETRVHMKLEKPTTLREAIQNLTDSVSPKLKRVLIDSELEDPRPNALVLVNGKEISILQGLETRIDDGDEIILIPVSHGG
jgi:molybdopterin converting factor small subunit